MMLAAEQAVALTVAIDRLAYDADETLRLALVHLVQTIGEAARYISHETRGANPAIPWSDIISMRHRIVHDYMNVDEDILWATVQDDLPQLVEWLKPLLPEEDPS